MSSGLYLTGVAIENKKSKIKEKLFQKKEENKSSNSLVLEELSDLNLNSKITNDNKNNIKNIENKEKFLILRNSFNSIQLKTKKKIEEDNILNNAEQELVDFMIHDETKFADLNQIEAYYKGEIDKNNKTFDTNNLKLEKQKLEMESIDLMIEKELLDNIDYDYDGIKNKYEDDKNRIMLEIKNKEHDMISFEKVRDNLLEKKV